MSRRSRAGLLSTDRSFYLPVGDHIEYGGVKGYYIDFTVKAQRLWPEVSDTAANGRLHILDVQRALGCYERHLAGHGDEWLAAAVQIGRNLLAGQLRGGRLEGGWPHTGPFPHTFDLEPPWLSGIVQGQGASLLVRLHRATGDGTFAEGAVRAVQPLLVPTGDGGLLTSLDGGPFFEEYPTRPGSFVLNGAVFATWGLYDLAVAGLDNDSRGLYAEATDTLARNLHRWDTGWWSRYDLYPHPRVNVASSFYHSLHVDQLRIMQRMSPHPAVDAVLARFERYARSPAFRRRALAEKVLFRIRVPRSRALRRLTGRKPS
jgi:heparosan-N-sulfate-glucuronate 5-epimerase